MRRFNAGSRFFASSYVPVPLLMGAFRRPELFDDRFKCFCYVTNPTTDKAVLRRGFAAAGDTGTPLIFYSSNSSCSLGGGNGDWGNTNQKSR